MSTTYPAPRHAALTLLPATHPELPQAVDSEKATLGSILLNRDAIGAVAGYLRPEMFYYDRHTLIYQVMLGLWQRRIPPDTRTVSEALRAAGQLDLCGGVPYISDLIDCVPTSYHIEYYARPVVETARLRRQITAGGKIAAIAYQDGISADDAAAQAHTLLTEATAESRADDLIAGADAVSESWDDLHSEAPAFVSTGFSDLDDMIGGLHGGDFVIIAARPAVGKTSWALSLLRNLCKRGAAVPLIFELEMDRLQLTHRLISMQSGVETRVLRMRAIDSDATHQALAEAHGTVGSWQWAVCDLAGQTPLQIRARTMRHLAEHSSAVIIVDYIGLMGSDDRRENRTQEVSALSLALKNLARDANVPIVALAQLSRAVEGRSGHRPMLSDLRDSGSLEQDADIVGFLYREELYDRQTEKKGIAELLIEKNRHGPTGNIPLRFDAATTRFDSLSNPFGGAPWQP